MESPKVRNLTLTIGSILFYGFMFYKFSKLDLLLELILFIVGWFMFLFLLVKLEPNENNQIKPPFLAKFFHLLYYLGYLIFGIGSFYLLRCVILIFLGEPVKMVLEATAIATIVPVIAISLIYLLTTIFSKKDDESSK